MLMPFNRQTSRVSAQACPPEEGLLVVPRRGQWAMMISLIFFVGPVVQAAGELSGLPLAASLVLAVAFIAVYWRTMVGGWKIEDRVVDDESGSVPRIAALTAIAAALVAIGGSDWAGDWCFVAAAVGLRLDRRIAFPPLFVLGRPGGRHRGAARRRRRRSGLAVPRDARRRHAHLRLPAPARRQPPAQRRPR